MFASIGGKEIKYEIKTKATLDKRGFFVYLNALIFRKIITVMELLMLK